MQSYASILLLAMIALGLLAPVALLTLLVARRRRHRHPACGRCRYDVTQHIGSSTRCPECGTPFAEGGILPPSSRRRTTLVAAVAILVTLGVALTASLVLGLRRAAVTQARAAQAQAIAAQARAQAAPAAGDEADPLEAAGVTSSEPPTSPPPPER